MRAAGGILDVSRTSCRHPRMLILDINMDPSCGLSLRMVWSRRSRVWEKCIAFVGACQRTNVLRPLHV